MKHKNLRISRHKRIRKKIRGTSLIPRLAVFRSNKHIYCQIVDDSASVTLVAVSDVQDLNKNNRIEGAREVGQRLAKGALSAKIKKVIFDRAGYKYHGRIKACAEGARKGGLIF